MAKRSGTCTTEAFLCRTTDRNAVLNEVKQLILETKRSHGRHLTCFVKITVIIIGFYSNRTAEYY